MARAALPLFLLAAAIASSGAACSDASTTVSAPAPVISPAAPSCAVDEHATPDGTCELFATREPCAPGTRPALGAEQCIAVGPTSCAPGFAKDASGWGCAPILPEAACSGATRPRLGDRACVPVGDCAAAFPAAGAILVDPALADGSLDATHVRTLADALTVASDGATIALADGSHVASSLAVSKAVTIAGRCAAKARLAPRAPGNSGLAVTSKVTLRGVTLDGYVHALTASGGAAALVAEDLVVERARSRGVVATGNASIALRRSVVRGTNPIGASDQTVAVLAGTGGSLVLEETAVLASQDAAVVAADNAASRVSLTRCVVQDTRPRPDGVGSSALRAFEGAHLDVTESAILDSQGMAILALRRDAPPPEVTVTRSVIGRTTPLEEGAEDVGTAVNAAYGAVVRVAESTISDSASTALYAAEKAKLTLTRSVVVRVRRSRRHSGRGGTSIKGAELTLEDSAVVGVSAVGLGVWDRGHVVLRRSVVREIGGDTVEGLPFGMAINAVAASSVDMSESAIVDALEVGVSAGQSSTLHLDRVLVTQSQERPAPRFGYGVLAVDLARFTITRSILERHPSAALFFVAAGGVLAHSLVRDNAIGAHVQEGSSLVEAEMAPAEAPEKELVITMDTSFVGNATRVSSEGLLPLPAPLSAP